MFLKSFCLSAALFSFVGTINAQAPNISYPAGNKVYIVGSSISTISPTNTGGAPTGLTGYVSTFAGSIAGFADGMATAAMFNSPFDVAVDASSNLYVADQYNNRIRKITSAGVVTTLAGSGTYGYADGTGTAASFSYPSGVAVDGSGNVYVADQNNHRIRMVSATGIVTTLAGSGIAGFADGTGTAASFNSPTGLAVDGSGNVYVADVNNNRIRKITSAGVVTTLAGSGNAGFADGTGSAARFYYPIDVAVDGSGNVYVADQSNNRIRKITAAGVVTTLAGSGIGGFADGTGTAASFNNPVGVAVDGSGFVYVADSYNNRIRRISSAGVVTTLAGSGNYGYADGTGTAASLNNPTGVAVDGTGNVYLADQSYSRIRMISPSGGYSVNPALPVGLRLNASTGVISGIAFSVTAAANYVVTATNGSGSSSVTLNIAVVPPAPILQSFSPASNVPNNTTVTIKGQNFNYGIASVSFGGVQANYSVLNDTTLTAVVYCGASGSVNVANAGGTASLAGFVYNNAPKITYPSPTTQNYLLGTAIPPLTPVNTGGTVGSVSTLASTTITIPLTPNAIAVDSSNGNVYVADASRHRILKISPAGAVTIFAGNGNPAFADGSGTAASFSNPSGLAVDKSGNIYVADQNNNRIRKITSAGVVTTLAGSGTYGYADGTGTAASFSYPLGVAVDKNGNIYVADSYNNRIRRITSTGVVTTLAGSGTPSFVNGTGVNAGFYYPSNLAVDTSNNVYVSDNQCIRKISPTGVVTTLAGSGSSGFADGTGTAATFSNPLGLALDKNGNVYVADRENQRIRRVSPTGVVTTLAGNGNYGFADSSGIAALFANVQGVALDKSGNIYVADRDNNRVRKISTSGGYSISPALPAGLSINPNNGVISGTPTAVTAAANYTVTARNGYGSSTSVLNLRTGYQSGMMQLVADTAARYIIDTVRVSVNVLGGVKIASINGYLTYDTARLTYSGFTLGNYLGSSNNLITQNPIATGNSINFGATQVSGQTAANGNGNIYQFIFVQKQLPDTNTIRFNATTPNRFPLNFSLQNMSVYDSSRQLLSSFNSNFFANNIVWLRYLVNVWPGDLNRDRKVDVTDLLPIGYFYGMRGPRRPNSSLSWTAQPAMLWGYGLSTVSSTGYACYADANGDGIIDLADQAPIGFNLNSFTTFRLQNPTDETLPSVPQFLNDKAAIHVAAANHTIVQGALPVSQSLEIRAGSKDYPVNNLYGLAFDLYFDPQFVEVDMLTSDFNNSIFGKNGIDFTTLVDKSKMKKGKVSFAITRINQTPIFSKGDVVMKVSLPVISGGGWLRFYTQPLACNNQQGETIEITGSADSILIGALPPVVSSDKAIIVYPNPAKGAMTIKAEHVAAYEIMDNMGKRVQSAMLQDALNPVLWLNKLSRGVYYIRVRKTDGTINSVRFVKD
ncbi:MAG: putative Ig domain-containing protein [Bacteroidetes bacterium]|nr:putative Ig domain-containing protein [Bacteroidota bacterium]